MQQDKTRIPRWLVESDPSWEKSIDSDLGVLKWTKKGTGMQAVCPPTGMFCDVVGGEGDLGSSPGLSDVAARMAQLGRQGNPADGITKYLSSSYLNPGRNGPRFDLRKTHRS